MTLDAKTEQERNKAWQNLKDNAVDILRICFLGPTCNHDLEVIEKCVHWVAAELVKDKQEQKELDSITFGDH